MKGKTYNVLFGIQALLFGLTLIILYDNFTVLNELSRRGSAFFIIFDIALLFSLFSLVYFFLILIDMIKKGVSLSMIKSIALLIMASINAYMYGLLFVGSILNRWK
ncbi:MAG: hypothetical protein FWE92_03080 [Defluviitaleaceae bacterium]|nr:hypothetical protein [Defluviitaleaceae bacterium]